MIQQLDWIFGSPKNGQGGSSEDQGGFPVAGRFPGRPRSRRKVDSGAERRCWVLLFRLAIAVLLTKMFRDNVFSKLPPEGFCLVKVVLSCFVLSCLATLRARLLKTLFLYFAKLL